jgi:hypothetical protein
MATVAGMVHKKRLTVRIAAMMDRFFIDRPIGICLISATNYIEGTHMPFQKSYKRDLIMKIRKRAMRSYFRIWILVHHQGVGLLQP